MEVNINKDLSLNEENIIKEQIHKSICKVKIDEKEKGFGFLCKIPKYNIKILIISYQIFEKKAFIIKNIELILNNHPSIILNEEKKFTSFDKYNIIIIDINNINLSEDKLLEIDENIIDNHIGYKNLFIYLLNNSYNDENKKNIVKRKIKYIDERSNIIEYEDDSFGQNNIFSLIINLTNYKVIGINNLQNGIYLKGPLEEFIKLFYNNKGQEKKYYLKKYNKDYSPEKRRADNNMVDNCQNLNSEYNNLENKNNSFSQKLNNDNINTGVIINKNFLLNLNNKHCNLNSQFLINIRFFKINKSCDCQKTELSGLLNLCLIKIISNFFDDNNINNIKDSELQKGIKNLRDKFKFSNDQEKDIKLILENDRGNNILAYSEYINAIINNQKINSLIYLLNPNIQNEIDIYWRCLSYYKEYSSFFEKEILKDLKQAIFDYSLISLNILEKDEEKIYKQKRNECPNMIKRVLYHGSQIEPISKILSSEFKYSRRPYFGMGIYFSDTIDYIPFYCGGNNFDNRRLNFGKILPVNETFSMIASEIFYDKTKLKQIKDYSLGVETELNDFPSYDYLKQNFPEKMVEPNGIHFVKVNNKGEPIGNETMIDKKNKGEFLANEYVITELYQILPIFSLTLKRKEYFVLWRDSNLKGQNPFSNYLYERIKFCNNNANMNLYCESSTEEALKFLWRRRYNKVILITSVGSDKSGKKFVKIARKIFGFNIMVLFFSSNEKNLEWIKDYDNCLYTNENSIYEYYITHYNKFGLYNLKKMVERKYKVSLKDFSNDFLSFPNFVNVKLIEEINFSDKNPYVKEVYIFCEKKKMYLVMTKDGYLISRDEPKLWDIIIADEEISLYSNGFYLGVKEDKENVVGVKDMKNWYFKNLLENYYYFIYREKKEKYILSMDGTWIKINKNKKVGGYELFKLIEQ